MHRLVSLLLASALALMPSPVLAGPPVGYGDPPGWCTNFSDMWMASVVTNDPLVGSNPERDTFYGFHANPGYDDWYGYFYGDFRGSPGDASGWVRLLHEDYPQHYHWNFGDFAWAVHGHARQYIAYYNWTFGGQCGFGARGLLAPPPYMADQFGYPVVDIYVDAVPPFPPRPTVASITPSSVTFTWDPVADRGDGAGRDFFVAGMDHYVSWATVSDRPGPVQLAVTSRPRSIRLDSLRQGEVACVHVQAVDRVQNATPVESVCGAPAAPPPMPAWNISAGVVANPAARGLVGLETWFWLASKPATLTADGSIGGIRYVVTATPAQVVWDFGDGSTLSLPANTGAGDAYPARSPVRHVYERDSAAGYTVRAKVDYRVAWTEVAGGSSFGPYPLGTLALDAAPLDYPVEQAQPELLDV